MRLMRGAGIAGLAGIAPVVPGEPCPVVRPLLGIAGPDLRAWLEAEGLPFREDASNRDRRFLRNRIRAELLPELERRYEPRVVAHLARLAAIAREEDELLDGIRPGAGRRVHHPEGPRDLPRHEDPAASPAGAWPGGSPASILRRAPGRPPGRLLRGRGLALSRSAKARSSSLRKGIVLRREAGRIGPKRRAPKPRPYRILWDGRGRPPDPRRGALLRRLRAAEAAGGDGGRPGDDAAGAILDAAKLGFPLLVRNRQARRPLPSARRAGPEEAQGDPPGQGRSRSRPGTACPSSFPVTRSSGRRGFPWPNGSRSARGPGPSSPSG